VNNYEVYKADIIIHVFGEAKKQGTSARRLCYWDFPLQTIADFTDSHKIPQVLRERKTNFFEV